MKKKQLITNLSLILFLSTLILSSCSTKITKIGKVSMVSNRNIETDFAYERIKSYSGLTKKDFKKADATSIDEAVDKTVKSVPGGEFLMNAKIYLINGKHFAVEGDVWGTSVKEHLGFKKGSKVQWKSNLKTKHGKIMSLIDDKECMVLENGKNKAKKVKYEELLKLD